MSKKFISRDDAVEMIDCLGDEFTVIKNPDYIFPAYEICPMAGKVHSVKGTIPAFVMDMDGTTTTTELLCLHSLEYMIRLFTGRMSGDEWAGLDHALDYPHIIGNSTTKHVEYLVEKYGNSFRKDDIKNSFIHAALWTLMNGRDEKRKEEVRNNVKILKLSPMLQDPVFKRMEMNPTSFEITPEILKNFTDNYGSDFSCPTFDSLVRAGIDVYYKRYHEILETIKKGEGRRVALDIFHEAEKHLIESMPGVLTFLSIINGWIAGEEIVYFMPQLLKDYKTRTGIEFPCDSVHDVQASLKQLAGNYRKNPAKKALVTSSIFYEADIVMKELMAMLQFQVMNIDMPKLLKEFLLEKFSDYNNVYDAFITASDSSEMRLKPHRDLYSTALYKLHVPKEQFNRVAGFEDSESGTIAIRTAGIGLCVALPFAQTKKHDLSAACYVCEGGLPEVLLRHKLFTV
ncbi:MAG: hypothetical protein HF314_16575 [Ignavibacteria bacterium]|jgi:beta-phosphoglucomutase-like phosphatase (HAD superfamily)|nr:hypothetical protein [Ignavibacteria bacterium]MCU7504699.1 hypothetical protein [Ignavibacteria bacterium]MCU7516301.1 hypothetical protein [Ignavibacteria bacterium]